MSAVTPTIKFENSPTESTVSLPGQTFSPLFPPSTELPTPAQETSDPMDQCSPESESDSDERPPEDVVLAALAASLSAGDIASVVAASTTGGNDDASGGQTRSLKRAKTADEKEQRRVERVLRNRRAAQSSRERKRLEVEALERRNKELETRINLVERANMILIDELNKARKAGGSSAPSPSLEALISSNTLTLHPFPPQTTPVAESAKAATPSSKEFQKQQVKIEPVESVMALPATSSKSANMTQRPAEMFLTNPHNPSIPSCPSTEPVDSVFGAAFSLQETIDTDRYVLENGFPSSPDTIDIDCHSLAGDSSLYTDIYNINDFVFLDQGCATDSATQVPGLAADTELAFEIPECEDQNSSKDFNLQPQSGASTSGCDDGGIAVGH
ncbi:basic region leucine zipper [Ceratocystis lukuohia]|uniref:Basic region leucine zipper n=1 Tax=Ceratocystis lukuohia TaxID=2019550 RepID=A0ABR4M901_9PEZI